jgi:lipopolysaccharide export system ATP-binding protein
MNHTLEIKGLSKTYGKRVVVKDVDISIRTGEIIGLLGPNGAGKTTTFYMIVGMTKPEKGKIILDGTDIGRFPMYERARMGIGYLPQEPSIFRKLTVRENLIAVLEINRKIKAGNEQKDSIEEVVERILKEFGLTNFADRDGYRLSGGERRRAEIARAIAINPIFLLFDEPFAGIDPIAIVELKKMLIYLKSRGIGILITDHNVRETLSITDRAYILSNGSILASGMPDELIKNSSVKESYLGDEFKL